MSVVKIARSVGQAALSPLDADDRAMLSMLVVWAFGFVSVALLLAACLGVAVRVFALAAG